MSVALREGIILLYLQTAPDETWELPPVPISPPPAIESRTVHLLPHQQHVETGRIAPMPKAIEQGDAKEDELPSTIARSDAKAHDSAANLVVDPALAAVDRMRAVVRRGEI